MIVHATVDDSFDVTFEARGEYRRGARSSQYLEPDEPDVLEDVVVRREGSSEAWRDVEDAPTLTIEEVDDALLEAVWEGNA